MWQWQPALQYTNLEKLNLTKLTNLNKPKLHPQNIQIGRQTAEAH